MVWRSSSAAATCPARVSCGAKVICRASAAMLSMRNFATGSIILLRREGVKVGSLHATDVRVVHNIVQTAVPASLLTRTLDHPGEAHSPLFAGLVHALTPRVLVPSAVGLLKRFRRPWLQRMAASGDRRDSGHQKQGKGNSRRVPHSDIIPPEEHSWRRN